MAQLNVALVGFAINGLAFWVMITIIVLGLGTQITAFIGALVTLGLSVAMFMWALAIAASLKD